MRLSKLMLCGWGTCLEQGEAVLLQHLHEGEGVLQVLAKLQQQHPAAHQQQHVHPFC